MPVYKRGAVWWVVVQHRGQRVRQSAGAGATKKEASKLEAQIIARLESSAQGRHHLDDALAKLLMQSTHLKSYHKLAEHALAIAGYVNGQLLTNAPRVAQDYIDAHPELRPATINRRIGLLRRACKLAWTDWEWIDNPVHQRIRLLPENNRQRNFLTREQVERICEHCTPGVQDAVWFACWTGVRLGELEKVGPGDVRGGTLFLSADNKAGRHRTIPLPPGALDIPLPIRATRHNIQKQFRAAARKAGTPARFHDLRHTYASWLLQAGASLSAVCDLMGHSTVTITKDLYGHLETRHLEEAVALLG